MESAKPAAALRKESEVTRRDLLKMSFRHVTEFARNETAAISNGRFTGWQLLLREPETKGTLLSLL